MTKRTALISVSALVIAVAGAAGGAQSGAKATMKKADGSEAGVAAITDTPAGIIISVEFGGLPAGTHAFHIHTVGKCEPPFTSAGDHFNPGGKKHGFAHDGGYHAGDLPNVVIPDVGKAKV